MHISTDSRPTRQGRRGKSGEGRGGEGAPVATRKPRAKRFVECFMESFRIVDFLSLRGCHRNRAGFMIVAASTYDPLLPSTPLTFAPSSII